VHLMKLSATEPCGRGVTSSQDGLVDFVGAQDAILKAGSAAPSLSIGSLERCACLYAVGPVKDLDGEITIIDSQPYISRVRGNSYVVERCWKEQAIFLAWSTQRTWQDIPVPASVHGYLDLQDFVKSTAQSVKLDTAKPFPFLLSGTPTEIQWHINVDRTEGKPITAELFTKSKANFVLRGEPVEIVGFYSEQHVGVFIGKYAPAIPGETGRTNAIHIHFVSRVTQATGHIDDMTLDGGMILRLPTQSVT
jgi:Alpha-acetolactate decarboxylase